MTTSSVIREDQCISLLERTVNASAPWFSPLITSQELKVMFMCLTPSDDKCFPRRCLTRRIPGEPDSLADRKRYEAAHTLFNFHETTSLRLLICLNRGPITGGTHKQHFGAATVNSHRIGNILGICISRNVHYCLIVCSVVTEIILFVSQVNKNFAINLVAEEPVTDVQARIVSCDGGGGALGHPKVYINLVRACTHYTHNKNA